MTSSKDLTPDAALFLPSIWTPWAAILCLHCHGPKTPNGAAVPDYDEALKPRKRRDDEGRATCDSCQADVWTRLDLAHEQNLVNVVTDLHHPKLKAGMQQTGGMCSAAGIYLADGRYVLASTDFDSDADDRGLALGGGEYGGLRLGLYSEEDELPEDDACVYSVEEAIRKIWAWAELPADLKIGEFNATRAARLVVKTCVNEHQREWEAHRDEDMTSLEERIDAELDDMYTCAQAIHSRGHELAFAEHEAIKAEVAKIDPDEFEPNV